MSVILLVTCLLGVGPYWSIGSDGSLIVVVLPAEVKITIEEPKDVIVWQPEPRRAIPSYNGNGDRSRWWPFWRFRR